MTASAWPVRPLSELVEVLDHRRVPVNAEERAKRPGRVPYYGATGRVGWIDEALFDEPLLLLGEDGVQFFEREKRKAYLIDGLAWVNNHAHVLKVLEDRVDRRFLAHQLNWIDYHGYVNGTTRLKLTKSAMLTLPMRVPDVFEQRRIVEVLEDHLSRLDAARQAVETAVARASTFLAANAREALESASGEVTTLGAVAHSVRNGIFVSRPGHDPDGVPILRISAVRPLRLDTEDIRYSGKSVADLSDAGALLTEGDLLFTRYNGNVELVGACAVVPDRNSAMTYPDKLIRVSVDRGRAHPSYVALACTFGAGRQQIRSCVKTTAGQAGVSGKDLKAVRLTLPDVAEQARVAARFDSDVVAVRRLQAELAAALGREAALRRAILEAAFSGSLTTSTNTAEAHLQ